ncbi:hypothetical protein ACK8GG_08800 [Micromonosporaceae bacterium DT55]|uniref:hypothetical protein n=1 Tax=Melissospora conviva TaxID=3388432 RepID=UPI003C252E71
MAIFLPVKSWIVRHNPEEFNGQVGWANILAFSVGVIGVVLVIADRRKVDSKPTAERLQEVAEFLSMEILRREGRQLAHLLSTDGLESRSAVLRFSVSRRPDNGKRKRVRLPRSGNTDEIVPYFLEHTRGRLLIRGSGGSGKTVLALALLVGLIQERQSKSGNSDSLRALGVPVYFNLTSWDVEIELTDWMIGQLSERYRLAWGICARLVHHGMVIPVLDGLDELHVAGSERAYLAARGINDFIAQTPGVKIVVACRSGEDVYDQVVRSIRDADEITLLPLTASEVVKYITTQCSAEPSMEEWSPVFERLRRGAGSTALLAALSTPWRLTVAVAFYRSGGSTRELLPAADVDEDGQLRVEPRTAYGRRLENLLIGSFVTAKTSIFKVGWMNPVSAEVYLRRLALMLGVAERPRSEIMLHELHVLVDQKSYLRAHRWVFWMIAHIPFTLYGLITFLGYEERKSEEFVGWWWVGTFFLNFILLVMLILRRSSIMGRTPHRLSVGRFRSRRALSRISAGLLIGAVLSFYGWKVMGWYGLGMGAAVAIVFFVSAMGERLEDADVLEPRDVVRYDAVYTVIGGVGVGFFSALYIGELLGFSAGFMLGGLAFIGWLYSSSASRYLVAAYVAVNHHLLPFRLGRFLEWGRAAGLIRVAGLGYEFRHVELQRFLANDAVSVKGVDHDELLTDANVMPVKPSG